MRHRPAPFAVAHKAALANDMLRYRPKPEYKVDEVAECGSAASLNLSDSTHGVRARGCSDASRDRFFRVHSRLPGEAEEWSRSMIESSASTSAVNVTRLIDDGPLTRFQIVTIICCALVSALHSHAGGAGDEYGAPFNAAD